jgi:hypothetical protein
VFTISASDVHLEQFRLALQEAGLRTDYVKKRIRRVDAWKRASSEIAVRFQRYPDHQNSLLVRPVGQDAQESHRLVMFERAMFRRGQHKRVETHLAWRLIYDRGVLTDGQISGDLITVEQQPLPFLLAGEEQAWVEEMIGPDGANLRRRFEENAEHLDAHGLRTAIRSHLEALDGINIKGAGGGGLYFVPQGHQDEIKKLARIVRSVGSTMNLIPLLDHPDQREMILEAVVTEAHSEARVLDVELRRLAATPTGRVATSTYAGFNEKVSCKLATLSEYETLLGVSLTTGRDALEELHRVAQELQGRTADGSSRLRTGI